MVTSSTEARPPPCPLGCVGGYVIDADRNSVTTCKCEERRTVLDAMPEDVRAANSTIQHAEWVLAYSKQLDRAVLEGAKADVLAVARCVHAALKISQSGRLAVFTDRELVKLTTASWREKDPEANSIDEHLVWPHVAIIWLGSLRQGPQASPEIVLDALKVRRDKRHSTWLAYDPERPCWIREQGAWAEVEEHVDVHFVRLEVPRILGASSKAVALTNDAMSTTAAATVSSPTPKAKTLTAKVGGKCSMCGEAIEKGAEFRWANSEKGRAHPACMSPV